MANTMNTEKKDRNKWNQESTYVKINDEIGTKWPQWKKEAYNEMFTKSTHATKLSLGK